MLSVDIEKTLGAFHLKVQFETNDGVMGMLGPSGCGKSMTLRCIAGIEKPDKGRIVLDGDILFDDEKHIFVLPQKRKVGYLFQNYALFPHMTVHQNILSGLHNIKSTKEKENTCVEISRLFHLEGVMRHRPHQLSGGQAQRAALARILVNKPRLLLLDEPFSALDSYLHNKLLAEMKELLIQYEGKALIVTHNHEEAVHLCTQIATMDAGSIKSVIPTKSTDIPSPIVVDARKSGEYQVAVPVWNLHFTTEHPVDDTLYALNVQLLFSENNTKIKTDS